MDGIMGYGSDSDGQDEPEDDKLEGTTSELLNFSKKSYVQEHDSKPCILQDIHSREASHTSDKSAVGFNFLGLEVSDKICSKILNHSLIHNHQKEIRKVQTSSGEVEIPSGDFWTDFTPEDSSITSVEEDVQSEYNQRQKESVGVCDHFVKNENVTISHQNSFKRLHYSESVGSDSKHIRISDQTANNSCGVQNHEFNRSQQTQRQLSEQTQRQLSHSSTNRQGQRIEPVGWSENAKQTVKKRVLYYIHSKVSPYMNIKPVNKCPGKLQNSWPAHDSVVNRLSWNVPNYSHLLLTCGMDTTVRVWNVWSSLDLCVTTLASHKKAVKHAEWCQAGRKILSCSYDRTAQVTDVETAKTVSQCDHVGFVTAGHMHPSNPNLFVTGTENMILKWDLRTPQAPIRCFLYKDKFGQVQDLLFINHCQEFVSCSDLVSRDNADRSIMIWDLRTGTVLSNQIFQERYMCTRLKLHPSGSTFMAQTHADYVAMFSTSAPYKIDKSKRYEGHKVQGHNIGFDISPDGALVYSGSADSSIHCYHQHSGRLIRKLSSKSNIITDVACHPVLPSLLASCTWGGSVSLWM